MRVSQTIIVLLISPAFFSPFSEAVSSNLLRWSLWFRGGSKGVDALAIRSTTEEKKFNNQTNATIQSGTQISTVLKNLVDDGAKTIKSLLDRLAQLDPLLKMANGDDVDNATSLKNATFRARHSQILSARAEQKQHFLDRIALLYSSLDREIVDAYVLANTDVENQAESAEDLQGITPQSDLTLPGRHFYVVTTASLPWSTGTAVNPLLRAAYLHRRTKMINAANEQQTQWVTIVLPWLELPEDQEDLYHRVFANSSEQENYIRSWLREEAGMSDAACPETGLQILFYPARYHSGLGSIFAMGDIMGLMDKEKMDVCILEEPEHCNWFRAPGDGWKKRFKYVVGIVHTNYKEYASSHYSGLWTAPAIAMMSSAMVRAYCHKLIKLSPVLQSYAPEKESISNVHGVRSDFLEEGLRRINETNWRQNGTQAYFIGKQLWAKGLDIMIDLEDYHKQCTGHYFDIDIYGNGPDLKDIQRAFLGRKQTTNHEDAGPSSTSFTFGDTAAQMIIGKTFTALYDAWNATVSALHEVNEEGDGNFFTLQRNMKLPRWGYSLHAEAKQRLAMILKRIDLVDLPKSFAELRRTPIPAQFPGRVDHSLLKDYKIFVNPSVSEVLCTTTAEALAMGKFVIIPAHPSNTFFMSFPNCLAYRTKFEFVANLHWALRHDPEPLSPNLAREFTWEAATDRLIAASAFTWKEMRELERSGRSKLDERIAWFHNEIGKGATGDMLRKIFGAGPVADQVKYTCETQQVMTGDGSADDADSDEYEDAFSGKFRRSSFAEAIRATIADVKSFIQ